MRNVCKLFWLFTVLLALLLSAGCGEKSRENKETRHYLENHQGCQ